MEISFNLTTPDGRPVSDLSRVLQLRSRELGETTKQTCVALAQNVLRSIRAQTRVASENRADIEVQIADGEYTPSWKRDKGSKGRRASRRILRRGPEGPEVDPGRVVWLAPKYKKGEWLHSYKVEDKVGEGKSIKYIVVCSGDKEALRYAKRFHKSRVRKYKSLAKHAVSLAMKQVYAAQGAPENVTADAKTVARRVVSATVSETGFNSGSVSIAVRDGLDYAVDALKDKQTSVTTALQNALAKMIGFVQQKIKSTGGSVDRSLLVPVEELIRGGATL